MWWFRRARVGSGVELELGRVPDPDGVDLGGGGEDVDDGVSLVLRSELLGSEVAPRAPFCGEPVEVVWVGFVGVREELIAGGRPDDQSGEPYMRVLELPDLDALLQRHLARQVHAHAFPWWSEVCGHA